MGCEVDCTISSFLSLLRLFVSPKSFSKIFLQVIFLGIFLNTSLFGSLIFFMRSTMSPVSVKFFITYCVSSCWKVINWSRLGLSLGCLRNIMLSMTPLLHLQWFLIWVFLSYLWFLISLLLGLLLVLGEMEDFALTAMLLGVVGINKGKLVFDAPLLLIVIFTIHFICQESSLFVNISFFHDFFKINVQNSKFVQCHVNKNQNVSQCNDGWFVQLLVYLKSWVIRSTLVLYE